MYIMSFYIYLNGALLMDLPSHYRVTQFLQKLVRTPSISGDTEAQARVQKLVVDYLQLPTVTGGTLPWTLIATDENPELLFICHVDTVPVGNLHQWRQSPFSGEIVNERLFGRGSVDMKAGLAAAAAVVRYAADHNHSAGILLTADEEIGLLGAVDAASSLPPLTPQLIIIPEPTENEYSLGHKGVSWVRVTAYGREAHASAPNTGINAIQLLQRHVMSQLSAFPARHDPYLGMDTLNLGTINGGTKPNVVPGQASLTVDMRTVETSTPLIEWLQQLCTDDMSLDVQVDIPPLLPQPTGRLLEGFTDSGPQAFATDGAALAHRFPTTPIVVWGPGERAQMHATNESLDLRMLEVAIHNYLTVLSRLDPTSSNT